MLIIFPKLTVPLHKQENLISLEKHYERYMSVIMVGVQCLC